MTTEKLELSLQKLKDAVDRLGEAVRQKPENPVIIDGTIQRFEFVFEQCWKTLQKALEEEGIIAGTPRDVLTKAYQSKWLEDDAVWLRMMKDRNETSHTYNEQKAREIYGRIPSHFKIIESCYRFLSKKFGG